MLVNICWIVFFVFVICLLSFDEALDWILVRMPKFVQRPFYKDWKKRVTEATKEHNSIMTYPMLVFIEFSLDKEFDKGGLRRARLSLLEQSEKVSNSILHTLFDKKEK